MGNSAQSNLCTLVEIDADGHLKPVARTYEAHNWEASAGPYSNITFSCNAAMCTTDLPMLQGAAAKYQLTTFDAPPSSTNMKDKAAKYLERSTFGATLAEINALDTTSNTELAYANWITEHMTNTPLTSHREFYRRHMNSRFEVATPNYAVTHPCQMGTRYRRFTFSEKDEKKVLTVVTRGAKVYLILDGFIRTIVDGPLTSKDGVKEFVDGRCVCCVALSMSHSFV